LLLILIKGFDERLDRQLKQLGESQTGSMTNNNNNKNNNNNNDNDIILPVLHNCPDKHYDLSILLRYWTEDVAIIARDGMTYIVMT